MQTHPVRKSFLISRKFSVLSLCSVEHINLVCVCVCVLFGLFSIHPTVDNIGHSRDRHFLFRYFSCVPPFRNLLHYNQPSWQWQHFEASFMNMVNGILGILASSVFVLFFLRSLWFWWKKKKIELIKNSGGSCLWLGWYANVFGIPMFFPRPVNGQGKKTAFILVFCVSMQ